MKKLVLLTCILVLISFISASAETIVIVGGWGPLNVNLKELMFLNEGVPGSVVVVPRQFLPLVTASALLYEQLKEKGYELPAIFIGNSFGGLVVEQFAEDHPELVKAMILIGTPREYRFAPKSLFHVATTNRSAHNIPVFVIAGDKSANKWYLRSPNDGTVELLPALSVEARAFRVFHLGHVELVHSKEVLQQILDWLAWLDQK